VISLLIGTASADSLCGEDTPATVDSGIAELWDAYEAVDEVRFDRSGKNLNAAIACLDRAPTPVQLARLHQAMAILSFVNGQTRASRRSLAAARLMDPGWKLDDELFPEGHPYRTLWLAATDPGPVEEIGRIAPDEWLVDGIERDEAPIDRGFLLQVKQNDEITWSGYLWSFDEIPDRGQSTERSALETPHAWWVSAGVHGRFYASRQTAQGPADPAVVRDQRGSAVGGGVELSVRGTPVTVVGFELAGSLSGPVDPVSGGGGQPSGHAVALFGGGGWVGAVQPWGAVRLGGSVDRMRTWTGLESDPRIWTIPSALAGIEGGIRSKQLLGGLAVDALLASARIPYEVRVRGEGGALVGGPLAVQGVLDVRAGGQPLLDRDGTEIAGRRNTDVRLGVALALWQ
jgi:hypothetical protein